MPATARQPGHAELIDAEMAVVAERIHEPGFRVALVEELAKLYEELEIDRVSPPRSTIDRWFSGAAEGNPDRILPSMDRWPLVKEAASRIGYCPESD